MGATRRKGNHDGLAIAGPSRPAGSRSGHEPGLRSVSELHSHNDASSADADNRADRHAGSYAHADYGADADLAPTATTAVPTATTAASTDTPAPTAPPTPTTAPTLLASAVPCTGSDAVKQSFADQVPHLSFDVYCAVLPSGWGVVQVQADWDKGGLIAQYKNAAGNTVDVYEGSFCSMSPNPCSGFWTPVVGATPFGPLTGELDGQAEVGRSSSTPPAQRSCTRWSARVWTRQRSSPTPRPCTRSAEPEPRPLGRLPAGPGDRSPTISTCVA